MRFHWYWPFARGEELDWAVSTARAGESILVEVIDREIAPLEGEHGPVTVVRDLPDVQRREMSKMRWVASRAETYATRAQIRRRHWREERFDLVHLHYLNRFTDSLVRLARPLVMSVHDVLPHYLRVGNRAERHAVSRMYDRADALIVHHSSIADALVREFGLSSSRVHVVPHQVFPAGLARPRPPEKLREVLMFGALRANKGLDVLAAAMAELPSDITLRIVGHGDPDVEALARRLAAEDSRVSVDLSFVTAEQKSEEFASAAIVVLPYSRFASQSGVLHDAYGHGRPVVVTDVGALGSTVHEDGTGIVVPRGDASALAKAIERALRPDEWQGYSEAARLVAERRSPAATGFRLREVYDGVLA